MAGACSVNNVCIVPTDDIMDKKPKCFVCDQRLMTKNNFSQILLSCRSRYSQTGLPTKIGRLMGDGFMVVVTAGDEVCLRCIDFVNHMDRLEVELEKVRSLLTEYLRKKYRLTEESSDPMGRVDVNYFRRLEQDVLKAMSDFNDGNKRVKDTLFADQTAAIAEENSKICSFLLNTLGSKAKERSSPKPSLRKFKCYSCDFRCTSSKELRVHEKVHVKTSLSKQVVFQCRNCEFRSISKEQLNSHICQQTTIRKFKCSICHETLESQKALDEHFTSHNIYQCADCGAAYEELEKLMVHSCIRENLQTNNIGLGSGKDDVSDGIKKDLKQSSPEKDFGELCRVTLEGESDVSATIKNNGKTLDEKNEKSGHEDTVNTTDCKTDNDSSDDVDEDYEMTVEDDEMFDDEDDDDDEDYDENDEYALREKGTSAGIFMDGVEVSVSDIVGDDGLLETQLVTTELKDETEEKTDEEKCKVFVCSLCKFSSLSLISIRKHLQTHSSSSSLECQVCKIKLKNQRTHDKHMKRHLQYQHPVRCNLCKEVLPDKFSLRKHMTDKHGSLFKCQVCGLVCASMRAKRRHQAQHSSSDGRSCDVCGKTFRRSTQLQIHKEYAHRDPKCRFCAKEFDTVKKLKEHEQRHTRDSEGFPCNQCSRVLKTSSGLKLHRAKHTGEYKFCCDVCGRGFMSKAIMDEHMGRHTQEKRYTCDVCGKMFVFNSTMRIHRRWHDNPLPYKCVTCGQKFRHTSLLSVHRRRMHTGERPYKCPYCPLSFTVSNCLKRHVVLHTGAYPYFCNSCNKGFTTKQKMAVHLAKIHNDREMLNAKAPPCEYKMVLPNQPGQGPADSDDEQTLTGNVNDVEHVEEVEHVIIHADQQHMDSEGNIQLQIITMDTEHDFPVFE